MTRREHQHLVVPAKVDQLHRIAGIDAHSVTLDRDMRIDVGERLRRTVDFERPHAFSRMHDLALKIVEADSVVIDDADRADTGRCQVHRDGTAQTARPDHEHARSLQLLLALATDLLEHKVALVALDLAGSECHAPLIARPQSRNNSAPTRSKSEPVLDHQPKPLPPPCGAAASVPAAH